MRASHWRLRSAWQRNARPASRTESSRLAWFILGRCEPCGDGRVYCWRGWQLRDRPAGHRPTVRRRAERTPLRIGKARRIKRRARIPMRECWWWRSAQDAAGARGQQSGVGICAPSRGTVRSEGSFLGSRICLRGCEKYTLLTMQAILNRHRLVWKGAKSERSLHGMGQVVFDRAGLGGIGAIQRFLQAHFCGFSARA
jgi:hypothetical protein